MKKKYNFFKYCSAETDFCELSELGRKFLNGTCSVDGCVCGNKEFDSDLWDIKLLIAVTSMPTSSTKSMT